MNKIATKLVKDGNSMAIRLPKTMLALSGIGDTVLLEAKSGQIIVHATKSPRVSWKEQIESDIAANGPLTMIDDYGDMFAEIDATLSDGADGLE